MPCSFLYMRSRQVLHNPTRSKRNQVHTDVLKVAVGSGQQTPTTDYDTRAESSGMSKSVRSRARCTPRPR